MSRPTLYSDEAVVSVNAGNAKTKLQQGSERRAIVNIIIENGGSMTCRQLDDHFGYIVRDTVGHLVRQGWLELGAEMITRAIEKLEEKS